jgi:hypothetical protein
LEHITIHRDGRTLSQSSWSPTKFDAIATITATHLLAQFPVERLLTGDVLATNDLWLRTGHLPATRRDYPLAFAWGAG